MGSIDSSAILYGNVQPHEAHQEPAGRVVDRCARSPLEAGLFRSALGLPA